MKSDPVVVRCGDECFLSFEQVLVDLQSVQGQRLEVKVKRDPFLYTDIVTSLFKFEEQILYENSDFHSKLC